MTYLGKIIGNCGSGIPRTGIGNCPKNEGKTVALMITAYDAQYPLDSEAFKAGLQGWVSAQGNQRMFPIKGIFENTRAGGEVQTSDLGFGGTW